MRHWTLIEWPETANGEKMNSLTIAVLFCSIVGVAALPVYGQGSDAVSPSSPNLVKLMSNITSGPATWVFIGDSITAGTGANSQTTGWASQVVGQVQKVGDVYGGTGFCSTEGSPDCTSVSTGTWTALQGTGPSQAVVPIFGETKTGSPGATWRTGPFSGNIVDILYYTDKNTSAGACSVSIDGGAEVTIGGATPAVTPRIYTESGLSNFSQHTVVVTSNGACHLYGINFRNATGLTMWNTARGGATTAAFGSSNQLSWLSVVPDLAGIVVSLGQNDIGYYKQTQSLANIQEIVKVNQSLANPAPMFFVFPEAPKYDEGQGALYAATEAQIVAPNAYDSVSIYNLWGANSYRTLPKLYVGGVDGIHPSQAGHNAIANTVLSALGVPPPVDSISNSTVLPYGSALEEKDEFGNTVHIASVTNGDQVNFGGSYAYQLNLGTGGAGGPNVLQILNNGHIAIAPSGPSPTVSHCGTNPSVNGNDVKGEIDEGAEATGCLISFGTPYPAAPSCVVTMQTGPLTYSLSARQISVVNSNQVSPGRINYVCF